ncbi:MAG TPA: hypothetical protein VG692_19090 [Gemmatimonadales bacterium]|nr:hypothetical protein [Gemmatimonadales bacterium]
MLATLLVLASLAATDTLRPVPDTLPDSTAAPVASTTAPAESASAASLAPTMDNVSLLGSALNGGAGLAVAAWPVDTPVVDTTPRRRPRAVEYSDGYYTRLKVHKLASYLTVPLFAAQYLSGRALWNNPDSHGLARDVHGPLAASVAGLFAVNTVTGVWNLWDSRKDPNGRTRRWVHGLLMIAADAGFVAVGATAPDDDFRENGGTGRSSGASTHRDLAIGSMSVALSSYLMMLIWK